MLPARFPYLHAFFSDWARAWACCFYDECSNSSASMPNLLTSTTLTPNCRLPRACHFTYACTTHPPLSRAHLSPDRPVALRAILYFFGLLWSFLGVGIISDIFMLAIEVR